MTRRAVGGLLLGLGLLLFAVGLILGFMPKSANGVDCGSAFKASTAAEEADFGTTLGGSTTSEPASGSYAAACTDARSSAKAPAVVLLIVGGVVAVAGGVAMLPSTGHRVQRSGDGAQTARNDL